MKKITLSGLVLTTLIITGCSSSNPKPPTQKVDVKTHEHQQRVLYRGETKFENIQDNDALIKVLHTQKSKNVVAVMLPAIDDISKEVKRRGYQYFQIVSPKQISNLEGFPINNKADLAAFLFPASSIPLKEYQVGFFTSRQTLMDNQESQNIVKKPFLFGDTELELIVRMVKEPRYNEIVWSVDR